MKARRSSNQSAFYKRPRPIVLLGASIGFAIGTSVVIQGYKLADRPNEVTEQISAALWDFIATANLKLLVDSDHVGMELTDADFRASVVEVAQSRLSLLPTNTTVFINPDHSAWKSGVQDECTFVAAVVNSVGEPILIGTRSKVRPVRKSERHLLSVTVSGWLRVPRLP